LCREEASWLDSKAPQMGNVKLHAVLHEKFGAEEFQEFCKNGQTHFDEKKHFFGPHLRRKGMMSVMMGLKRMLGQKKVADAAGIQGNMKGDGLLLGGLVVIGPGDQGILYQNIEDEIGNRCDMDQVMAAVEQIKASQ